ncbi:alpha/beta hydrolase family protein [Pseudomonas schmalbachii]|uniref:Alpha/beta hydrolase family protein n=1 Tax=Pseudomonas schmalbachii TaxID=2816993 RepID=A0ABS3TV66_9PSED|nr:alpha/beta hydrolase family protein [Pseudomonas schmalbachii]MBO3277561.1 alpha/beta hydrolase family protein [Pseudomonas schmalbachii]
MLRPLPIALCLSLSLLPLAPLYAAGDATPEQVSAAERRAPANERSQDAADGLERRLPSDALQKLQAGRETFLALWEPANVARPAGVVILIPGDGESADWPVAIGPLRRKLPDAGWQTLSLSLPDPQSTAPVPLPVAPADKASADSDASATDSASRPEVEGSTGAAPAPESTAEAGSGEPAQSSTAAPPTPIDPIEQRKAHAERVLARIQAGVDLALQHKPEQVILLGHGTGAYWAARYLGEREPAEIHNLLVVDAQAPEDFRPALETMLPSLGLAIGDFYYRDDAVASDAARLRLQAGKRQQHPAYTQVGLTAVPANPDAEQEQLYRRIRGWLTNHLQSRNDGS